MQVYPASYGMMAAAYPTASASAAGLLASPWAAFAAAGAQMAMAMGAPQGWGGGGSPAQSFPSFAATHSAAHSEGPLDVFMRSEQGTRPTQEDAVAVKTVHGRFVLLGLFDGHAGAQAAEFCRANTLELAARRIGPSASPSEVKEAIRAALVESDQQFLQRAQAQGLEDGTTALLACVADGWIHIAHVGDSRAVVAKESFPNVEVLTRDHTPSLPSEAARVRQAGGQIGREDPTDVERVYPGGLAVSRAIGDLPAKHPIPAVSGIPDVSSFPITADMKYLVLACDGVWDVVSPKMCAETVLVAGGAADAVHRLVDLSFARRTTDNVSVVIAALRGSGSSSSSQPQPQQLSPPQTPQAEGGRARSLSLSPGLSLSLSPASLSVSRSPMAYASPYATGSPVAGYTPSFGHVLQF